MSPTPTKRKKALTIPHNTFWNPHDRFTFHKAYPSMTVIAYIRHTKVAEELGEVFEHGNQYFDGYVFPTPFTSSSFHLRSQTPQCLAFFSIAKAKFFYLSLRATLALTNVEYDDRLPPQTFPPQTHPQICRRTRAHPRPIIRRQQFLG